jgi:hypothetical protein
MGGPAGARVADAAVVQAPPLPTHGGDSATLIGVMATGLRDELRDFYLPGGRAIAQEFMRFEEVVSAICAVRRIEPEEITFSDIQVMAAERTLADTKAAPDGPGPLR